ncbi:lantibiotic dehydratase C-terminal domain-containing protein [Streptomyces sp. NPDC014735]|uniref:lantibiotic dehydratase C-terminal domain-containing protein n=1 Tax=Streptomyces sp. NPDC014735 TaxID=3364887 RepID=UPI0036FB503B
MLPCPAPPATFPRLHCQTQVRRALLTDHLPSMAASLPHWWWVTAHDDGDRPHTEVTLLLPHPADAAEVLSRLGQGIAHLNDARVISDVTLVPYRPRLGLWGSRGRAERCGKRPSTETAVIACQLGRPSLYACPGEPVPPGRCLLGPHARRSR